MNRDWDFALELGVRTSYLMDAQARTGVHFDTEKAKEVYEYCCTRMQEIEQEVEPHLGKRELNKAELKDVTPPSRQQRAGKDGLEPSSYSLKFKEKMKEEYGIDVDLSNLPLPQEPLITTGTMRLKHQPALKQWLMDKWGWRPTLWNFKKDKYGKFERDQKGQLIKTSPKFHDKGELCPNLEKLGEVADVVKPIVEWLSLRNRKSVIWNPEKESGWLSHPRLQKDGRLPAGAGAPTNTLRQKHRVVANIPRVSSTLGKEMRSLFCAPEGRVLVGYDAAGLEARVEAHWCYKYEGGKEYAHELIDGDAHSRNARIFFGDDIPEEDGKVISKYRDPAKNGKYALTYGCTEPRLADTINVPLEKAKQLYADFWEGNTALAGFRDSLTKHWEQRGSTSIKCPLTGYVLHSRSKHSLVNLVFQHTGSQIMDLSFIFMDKWLGGLIDDSINPPFYSYKGTVVKRVLYVHDEGQWECDPSVAEEIGKMGVKSIIKAGEYLGLNVPLDAEYKVGKTWEETH